MEAKTIRTHWYLIVCFIAVSAIPANSRFAASIADFAKFSLLDSSGRVLLPGRLYIPPIAAANNPRPLMIFLHGSGADGTDNVTQLGAVSDEMVSVAKQRGAFVYVPQTANNWNSSTISGYVMTMVTLAIAQQHADARDLYITGYSNGGGGTWDILSRYPGHFAAAITISGVPTATDFVAAHLVGTPLLALHARDDATAPVNDSRAVINGILSADHQALPSYLGLGSSSLFVSNPTLEFDRDFDVLVHQQGPTIDFFTSDPNLDLMYDETSAGGHSGLVGSLNAPQPYDWLFSHTISVPEPSTVTLMVPATALLVVVCRRKKCPAVKE